MSQEDIDKNNKMNELYERLKREKYVRDIKKKEEDELRLKKELEEREERRLRNIQEREELGKMSDVDLQKYYIKSNQEREERLR